MDMQPGSGYRAIGKLLEGKRKDARLTPGRVAAMIHGWRERDVLKIETGAERVATRIWLLAEQFHLKDAEKSLIRDNIASEVALVSVGASQVASNRLQAGALRARV